VLLRAIKRVVDTDRTRGQYLLTGSTRFLTVPTISESLAGRAGIVDLWPYTQGELLSVDERIDQRADSLLGDLLDPSVPVTQLVRPPGRADYLARICTGGFPEVQELIRPADRRRWFDGYLTTVTSRDVPGISRIQHAGELPTLLAAVAATTGQQLVVTRLAEQVRLARQTVDSTYLPLLETVFMVVRLPAWSRNLLARVTRHPKVDVVAEAPDGRVGGIEVKASATVSSADFRHLARLRDLLDASGGRFVRGVVLYPGDQVLSFGDRLVAMPLAALWLPSNH
jgi:hypothetical protein